MFNEFNQYPGNLSYVNLHPNEPVQVDPWLYQALAKSEASGSRAIYLAPLYDEYRNLFAAANDAEAAEYDPLLNPEKADEFREVLAYARDSGHVKVELLPEDTVCLHVSDAYLAYAAENGIWRYIDFFWLKNAFIADFIADTLSEEGYTYGSLTSYDGFIRNFDTSGQDYSLTLLNETDGRVIEAGTLIYNHPRALVTLRQYALTDLDALHYYRDSLGRMRVPYISEADGLSHAAVPNLLCWQENGHCADIALQVLPLYAAETLDTDALAALAQNGIHSLWFRMDEIVTTDSTCRIQIGSPEK